MAMFAMEISFLLALAVFAAGLVLLHFARQARSALLRAAAAVLLVGSALSAACTVYWGIRYHAQGDFESAYPTMARGMLRGGPGEGMPNPHGMLGPGMMGPGMLGRGMGMGPGAAPEAGRRPGMGPEMMNPEARPGLGRMGAGMPGPGMPGPRGRMAPGMMGGPDAPTPTPDEPQAAEQPKAEEPKQE